tara:strand:- start:100 stop:393 length:294 start_codon:yes stop_codon:yes gene_type:complete
MKNKVLIDMDTDRKDVIRLSKPEDELKDILEDKDTAKKMLFDDLTTICNGLGSLIKYGEDNKHFESGKVAELCVKFLEDNFINPNVDASIEDTTDET